MKKLIIINAGLKQSSPKVEKIQKEINEEDRVLIAGNAVDDVLKLGFFIYYNNKKPKYFPLIEFYNRDHYLNDHKETIKMIKEKNIDILILVVNKKFNDLPHQILSNLYPQSKWNKKINLKVGEIIKVADIENGRLEIL